MHPTMRETTMALDAGLAERLVSFFAKCPPSWIHDYRLPPRAPLALAFAAMTGAGYDYEEIAAVLSYSEWTPRTYVRDLAAFCVDGRNTTRKKGLELLAHAHLAESSPSLLAELIRTDVLRSRYPTAS
jgi:hypothetical protein